MLVAYAVVVVFDESGRNPDGCRECHLNRRCPVPTHVTMMGIKGKQRWRTQQQQQQENLGNVGIINATLLILPFKGQLLGQLRPGNVCQKLSDAGAQVYRAKPTELLLL